MGKELIPLQELEWYQELCEECRAIIVETRFNSAVELLRGKWELGKRVTEEELNFQRAGYGEKIVEILAKDLGMSAVHLWKCIQFYKKFPKERFEDVISELPEGKSISWYKVYTQYLPKHKEEIEEEKETEELQQNCSHRILRCVQCKKEFNFEELVKWIREQEKNL
jgi:hypothetical protein